MKVPRRPGSAPLDADYAVRVTTVYKAQPKGPEEAMVSAKSSSTDAALGMAALPE